MALGRAAESGGRVGGEVHSVVLQARAQLPLHFLRLRRSAQRRQTVGCTQFGDMSLYYIPWHSVSVHCADRSGYKCNSGCTRTVELLRDKCVNLE